MDHEVEAVRRVSAQLFGGARYRLEVCGALQPGETITAPEVARRLKQTPSRASLHVELKHLQEAGLLVRKAGPPGDRHVYLHVSDCNFWAASRELVAQASRRKGNAA